MHTVSRSPEAKKAGLDVARILLELKAVDFRPTEPYTLTSGWASPVYVDCRKIISFPRARNAVVALSVSCLEREVGFECFDAVAGGETAGIPYAAWVADKLALPMQYVRKKPKGFGRGARIEGELRPGQRVLLVEDLATDGGSKIAFAEALREAGGQCEHALVVFFYGVFSGALKTLEEAGMTLHFLSSWWDVLEAAETTGSFDKKTLGEVRNFLHDPIRWSAARGGRGAE